MSPSTTEQKQLKLSIKHLCSLMMFNTVLRSFAGVKQDCNNVSPNFLNIVVNGIPDSFSSECRDPISLENQNLNCLLYADDILLLSDVCRSVLITSTYIQVNPGNSNCQGKLKLLRVIGVSIYRHFQQKDQKHLIKEVSCIYMFYCTISGNVRA